MLKLLDNKFILKLMLLFIFSCKNENIVNEDLKIFYKEHHNGITTYLVYINPEEYFPKNRFHFNSISKTLKIKESIYIIDLCREIDENYPEEGCVDCCLINYYVKNDSVSSYTISENNFKGRYKNNLDWDKFINCYNCIRTEYNDKYKKGYKMERIREGIVIE